LYSAILNLQIALKTQLLNLLARLRVSGAHCAVTFAAKNRAACGWLERDRIGFAALITSYLVTLDLVSVFDCSISLLRAATGFAVSRPDAITLIVVMLIALSENEY
jgi:hypothetical protein